MREQLAWIDRSIAQTRRFQDEANELRANDQRLRVARVPAPLALAAAVVGAGFVTLGPSFVRSVCGH